MTKAEEILKDMPSVNQGLDDFYGRQTVLNALNKALNLFGVMESEKVENKPSPLNWLLRDKLGIEKGTTYIEPKLTVRQCASWISEYVKKHY